MPLIEVKSLKKSFADQVILKDIDINIDKGEIIGLIGASGAGKTTLLRTLIGFYRIDGGQILLNGNSIGNNIEAIRQYMGFSSQDNCIYQDLTPLENLEYFGKLHGLDMDTIKDRAKKLLELVELADSANILSKNLSGGMQRRLDVACSMIHGPRVLIMDEPTTGLDPVLRKHMSNLIERINSAGTTIIISSHLLEDIEHLCKKIAIMYKGRMVAFGTPAEIKDKYSSSQEIILETHPGNYKEIAESLPKGLLTRWTIRGHKLVIYSQEPEQVLHDILHILEKNGEKLLDVDVNKPSLNEVFEAFTCSTR